MDLKKMYKSFSRLIITVVVLQFYGTLSATFWNSFIKLACHLTTVLDHFISFTLSGILLE